ncbi:MAG: GerW family sporulation protein [Bryobacteraceae bacterium]
MRRKAVLLVGLGLICAPLVMAQKPVEKVPAPAVAQAASELADELSQRLSNGLHVKTVVGEAIKVGSVTLIPILMVDVNFAGAGVAGPASGAPGIDGFLMSGEVRPLGFVAVTKTKTRFISAGTPPAK